MSVQDWITLGLFAVTAWYAFVTHQLLRSSKEANGTATAAVKAANDQLVSLKQEVDLAREQLEVQERHLWSAQKLAICATVLAQVDRTMIQPFEETGFVSEMLAAASKLVLVGEPLLAQSVRELIQPTIKAYLGNEQANQNRKQLVSQFTADVSERLAVKDPAPKPSTAVVTRT